MVSPQTTTTTDVAPGIVRNDRGFVQEETIRYPDSSLVGGSSLRYSYPTYFWGSVIAGTLFVLSLFVLSYCLMLGCHVGVNSAGVLALGWGSAIWICITAAIAYYFGGMIANQISRPLGAGWLKGAAIWGLSIPLALVIGAVIAGGSGLLTGLNMPHFTETVATTAGNAQQVATNLQPHVGMNFGFIWTAFVALIVGLIFSVIGSGSAVPVNAGIDRNVTTDTRVSA
ncbi:MAG TPA: hypothetical protein VN541_11450 [Tepidisphaeraceae bacterium]|nr:hypothetical protein [Tepidisphaeraceae bacterium]